ncbi:MAG: DUF2157 domain-containing protein, partial [Candidatus Accumulibacter sp.]|nr:DUF2157 domain-containing protein [Accumulibacter sp.]
MFFETTGKMPPPVSADAPRWRLAWGLFWRFLATQSSLLFFAAALVCFFAFNWTEIPAFAKFGLIGTLIAASALPAFLRGFSSSLTHAGLLLCGILGGVLFAVYGQVYQTGADAWELFRSWTLWLIPLFLLSRRSGLFFTLWIVATLWALFYWRQILFTQNMRLFFLCSHAFVWAAFETASRHFSRKELPFLRSRWIPRCIGALLLACVTLILSEEHIFRDGDLLATNAGIGLLFLCVMAGGGYWYVRVKHDLFMIAVGLLSLIVLITTKLFVGLAIFESRSSGDTIANLLFVAAVILGLSSAAWKLLAHLHRQKSETRADGETAEKTPASSSSPESAPSGVLPSLLSLRVLNFILRDTISEARTPKPFESTESSGAEKSAPWAARMLVGFCAWLVVPLLIGALFFLCILIGIKSLTGAVAVSFFFLLGGIAISGRQGVFLRQVSLCVALMAAIAISFLLVLELELETTLFIPAILVFGVSAFWMRNEAYRFLATIAVVLLSFAQLSLFIFDYGRFRHFFFRTPDDFLIPASFTDLRQILFFALFALLSATLVLLWENSGTLSTKLRALDRKGILIALMVIGLSPLSFKPFSAGLSMCGVGAGIGLLVFAWRLSVELSLSKSVRNAALFLCLAVTIAAYWLPWAGVGLFALALARYAASFPLFG